MAQCGNGVQLNRPYRVTLSDIKVSCITDVLIAVAMSDEQEH